jgi:hypothetical protein
MKHIERISERQQERASKRLKNGLNRPYYGPVDLGKLYREPRVLRMRLRFDPPITAEPIIAEWKRWKPRPINEE